ncbi:MAG: diguanylate cyclase domain-containing protein, partial [Haliea sp.]
RAIDKVAAKIVRSLGLPFELHGQPAQVSASIGIAFCPSDATDPEELLKKADHAMYRAKTSRHQNICFFNATSPGSTLH